MAIILDYIEQGTEWWHKARIGRVTASKASMILSATGKVSTQQKTYMYQLAGEILSGAREETFKSWDMENGNLREEGSRDLYSFETGNDVKEVGIVYKDTDGKVSCSPDGLIYEDDKLIKGLELKNPKMATHVGYLLGNKIPTTYIPQVQSSMYICELDEWDFVSCYTGLDPLIINVKRDDEWINKFHEELHKFLEKLDGVVNKLRRG